jgi:hypothetical protein
MLLQPSQAQPLLALHQQSCQSPLLPEHQQQQHVLRRYRDELFDPQLLLLLLQTGLAALPLPQPRLLLLL